MRQSKVKFAGISITNGVEMQFHTTSKTGKIGIWFEVPGFATYDYVKLPRPMTKIDAVRYCLRHHNFKTAKIQKFLKKQLQLREAGLPINPRKKMAQKELAIAA